ncbi:MAG: hypothetical protein WAT92_07035 [Saprospiraceae bacterium]|nr:hypothetical protein [Saprospiraceae bacterium]
MNKRMAIAAVMLFTLVMLSSCKRGGYGCPYEMKVGISILK